MNLTSLLSHTEIAQIIGNKMVEVVNITHDSREVTKDSLFVCIRGFNTDGHQFAHQAKESGASALVVEELLDIRGITQVKVPDSRLALAELAGAFYRYPSKEMTLVGVTGTNGKTTTTFLIDGIFKAASWKTGLIGTLNYKIGDQIYPVSHTTPEASDLQAILRRMSKESLRGVSMEVSSHAVTLHRVKGCFFKALVFTNLSIDHLDFHKNMDNYYEAKKRLFTEWTEGRVAQIVNLDDEFGQRIAKESVSGRYHFGIENKDASVLATEIKHLPKGTYIKITSPIGSLEIETSLKGIFNVYNILGAVGVGIALGFPLRVIKDGIESVRRIPGRFEEVHAGQEFQVIVDYAHTPEGLRKVLETSRSITEGRLIVVFGCGGDRDKSKRPIMGEIAKSIGDHLIITSDNPRSEDPETIINEIEQGVLTIDNEVTYEKVVDRYVAIARALSMAGPQDTVMIAGKGHETGQIFSDRIIPFDDREVAIEIIDKIAAMADPHYEDLDGADPNDRKQGGDNGRG